jgi:putative nucleotidyltransferase with HDIG domain
VTSTTVSAQAPVAARRDLIPRYAGLLVAATAIVAGLSDFHRVSDSPVVFGLLIVLVISLDRVRINLFERANTSPATVPALVLACLFGPLGPIIGEATVALARRNTSVLKRTVDFGLLSLSGVAGAGVFAAMPSSHGASLLAVSALAGLVYYAANSLLISVVWRLHEGIRGLEAWLERMAWLWPHNIAAGLAAGMFVVAERSIGTTAFLIFFLPLAMSWVTQKQYLDRSRSSVAELRRSHAELERANAQLQQLLASTKDRYLSTIASLARTIEAKDPYTGGHTERVGDYTLMLARELGFGEEELEAVEMGAIIHDIGKIGIPDRILLKPGRLDTDEFSEMRRHPEISSYILEGLDLPQIVHDMARNHHERFDGNGYPDGLAGEEIPLAARILTVADAFDAMTSDRPYRSALAVEDALAEIRRNAGTQFCPTVVAALDASFTAQARG